jgi:hypothetical protein
MLFLTRQFFPLLTYHKNPPYRLPVTTPPTPDQFVDAAYTPSLLPNHGVGVGRGARFELLDDEDPVDVTRDNIDHGDHVDHMHGAGHAPKAGPPLPGSPPAGPPSVGPSTPERSPGTAASSTLPTLPSAVCHLRRRQHHLPLLLV